MSTIAELRVGDIVLFKHSRDAKMLRSLSAAITWSSKHTEKSYERYRARLYAVNCPLRLVLIVHDCTKLSFHGLRRFIKAIEHESGKLIV